jgi:predicted metal-dependent phosphoesterase TrpH
LFIPGIEISAKEGHIVAYGIEEWSYGAYQLTLDEVLDTCAGLGATVVVAHPLDRRMGIKGRLFEPSVISRIHGYEALNGASPRPNLNLLRSDRSALRSLAVYSGSDCHSPVLFYKFHVEVEASSPRLQDILEAMRKRSRVKPIGPVLDLGHWIADFPPAFSHRRRIKQVEHRGRENK